MNSVLDAVPLEGGTREPLSTVWSDYDGDQIYEDFETDGQTITELRSFELGRGRWSIENNLFGIRDATFGEDACRAHTGHGPQNLAATRNLTVGLLNLIGCANKAAAVAVRRLREPP